MAKYGIRIDPMNKTIVCPFKHHQNGNERTGSFNYYPESNSFWCFGCKTGRGTTDFVAAFDSTTRTKAAYKIVKMFVDEIADDWEFVACNTKEKQDEIISFANSIRTAISKHPDQIEAIERLTFAFDAMNEKYGRQLNIEALKALSSKLQAKLPP